MAKARTGQLYKKETEFKVLKSVVGADLVPPAYLHRGTSLISNSFPLGPYSRTMPKALWW